jgi:hypothetical protein
MLALILLARTRLLDVHYLRELPFLWFFAGCILAYLLLALRTSSQSRTVWLRRFALGAGLFVIAIFLVACLYSLRCYMLQFDEANILGVAAESLHGPMYLEPGSPVASYSLMYGPVLFMIYRVALVAGGADHFWVLRATVILADFAILAGLYLLLRKFVSRLAALALLAFPLSVLLQHPESSLALRADIWIVLFTTLALLCTFLEAELLATVLTGLMCGILVSFKISAAPAALFPLLLLYRRFGFRAVFIASPIAAVTAIVPFTLPGVSFHNYFAWILFTRSEGLNPPLFWTNVIFALFLLSPCLVVELCVRSSAAALRQRLPYLALIVLCLAVAALTSKPGSGPWYLWQVVPSIVVYLGLALKSAASSPTDSQLLPVYFIALACALIVCVNFKRSHAYLKNTVMPPVVVQSRQSMDTYLAAYRDRSSVQMGYGSVLEDVSTSLRYVLVYKGQPYTLEGNTGKFETRLLPFPVDVLKQMQTCKDDVWLIPHAQQPFDQILFPDVLRSTFLHNYSIDKQDDIYDAWTCNHPHAHP